MFGASVATLPGMFRSLFREHRRLILVASGVLIAAGVVMAWQLRQSRLPDLSAAPSPVATGTPGTPPALAAPPPAVVSIQPYWGEPVSELAADPEFLKQVPAATYQRSLAELSDLAMKLSANPGETDLWMRVGFIRQFYHDYAGAADAYEYMNTIAGDMPVPFYNLGSLYGYYLKEPERAIPKYEAAIRLDPVNVSFYLGLASFWREVKGDPASAERVLLAGLVRRPAEVNFRIALGGLYRAMGRTADAITHYEAALDDPDLPAGSRAAIRRDLEQLRGQALPGS